MNVMKELREGINPDSIGRGKDGLITLRNEFFYTHGATAEMFAERVRAFIAEKGLPAKVVDCGEHWAAFRGGASTRNSSHWWVRVAEIDRPTLREALEDAAS